MVFSQILKYKNKKNITSAYNLEDFQCSRKVLFDQHQVSVEKHLGKVADPSSSGCHCLKDEYVKV